MFRSFILNLNSSDKNTIDDNGAIFCFGIKHNTEELLHMIIPPNPITRMFYKCDKTFLLDQYNDLFELKASVYVVFIDGKECLIYKYNGLWTKIKHMNALLVKRQNKGGQSSIRFARIAEESRMHYITNVVDSVNTIVNEKSINYVFGGEELKNMFLSNPNMKYKFNTESKYFTFDKNTIYDPYFSQLASQTNNDDEIKKSSEIINLLETEPDYLLFSMDEIFSHLDMIEYIIVIDKQYEQLKKEYENVYVINFDNPNYSQLAKYKIIAKKYWIGDTQYYTE